MTSTGRFTTKAIAVSVIVTMLYGVGFSPVIMVFVTGLVFIVWLFARRAQDREVERVFEFYVAADAILREEERRWYGFEIAEVIEHGEGLFDIMPDPPPLSYFALGALYHRLGNYEATVEYLGLIAEDEHFDEAHRTAPSRPLRRYVSRLREIEYHPAMAPQVLAAIRSLERARQRTAAQLLFASRGLLEVEQRQMETNVAEHEVKQTPVEANFAPSRPLSEISAPPSISKVLREVYPDETRANN